MLAIIIYFIAAQIIEFQDNTVSEVCFDIEDSQDQMEIVILDTIRAAFDPLDPSTIPIGSK